MSTPKSPQPPRTAAPNPQALKAAAQPRTPRGRWKRATAATFAKAAANSPAST